MMQQLAIHNSKPKLKPINSSRLQNQNAKDTKHKQPIRLLALASLLFPCFILPFVYKSLFFELLLVEHS